MGRSLLQLAALLALSGSFLGCTRPPVAPAAGDDEPPWFEDATDAVGLRVIHDAGPVDGRYFMPQIVGSGAALFDFDGDGLLDLYVLHGGGPKGKKNQLFRQTRAGRFVDVSKGSGLDFAGHCQGVAIGDVNNDGLPDVCVTLYTGVRLFLNNGNGTFTDVTKAAGLDNPLWATSASFLDYDRDGWLDLFVTNYLTYDPSWVCTNPNGARDYCAPKTFKGTTSRLFRNLGRRVKATGAGKGPPAVRFADVSFESGVGRLAGPGLGVVCADFNGDGWPDVFVANDGAPNYLWINKHNGTFAEEGMIRGIAVNKMGTPEGNMGVGWGDVDGDGLQDLFVSHLDHETNTVWKQGPPGIFLDWTVASGMNRPKWRATGFGTLLADFDRDGSVDAAVVNGAVTRGQSNPASPLGPFWSQYGQRNQLFANDGKGHFRDISPGNDALCGYDNVGRGLAVGDLRNDGGLALVVTPVADRVRVFRNVVAKPGRWLVVRAYDPRLKRDMLGAEVLVKAGGRRWIRTLQAGGSFLSSNDPRGHFGLGSAERFEAIEVRWPDGTGREFEAFDGGKVDRSITLVRGKGRPLTSFSPGARGK
jgi:hypothetical protein